MPVFVDVAGASGLHFRYDNDPTPYAGCPRQWGAAWALLDYDGDGWLDVYAVQGGTLSNESTPPPSAQRDRLFRNRGDGTFEDVTAAAGLAALPGGYGHGVAVGDYDNDGRPDLFITRWRSYALYHNRGDGTFEDVTEWPRACGQPRLAHLGRVRRPRRRRRPRPLRLPLRRLGSPRARPLAPTRATRTSTATAARVSSTAMPDHRLP